MASSEDSEITNLYKYTLHQHKLNNINKQSQNNK